jgi:hypothetical protein
MSSVKETYEKFDDGSKKVINVLVMICIIIVLLWLILWCLSSTMAAFRYRRCEPMIDIDTRYPRVCRPCAGLGKVACAGCKNCGFCRMGDGRVECVAGNADGPLVRRDCVSYDYNGDVSGYPGREMGVNPIYEPVIDVDTTRKVEVKPARKAPVVKY